MITVVVYVCVAATLGMLPPAITAPAPGTVTEAEPRMILSAIAGWYRCIGVPNKQDGALWSCPIISVPQCGGAPPVETHRWASPLGLQFGACRGQKTATNFTSQDATPVTFNWPVDMATVDASDFEYRFADGSAHAATCVVPHGLPASELNEGQTIAVIGDAGGWYGSSQPGAASATSLAIIGDLDLVAPNGSKVSATGLVYSGPSLVYANGPVLLTATLASQLQLLTPCNPPPPRYFIFIFQIGLQAKSGLETCFGPCTVCAGAKIKRVSERE